MIYKDDNHTRYNTDDLNALLEAVARERITFTTRDYRGNEQSQSWSFSDVVGTIQSIQPLYGDCGLLALMGDSTLRVRTPAGLSEFPDLELAMIGAVGSGQLPTLVVESLLMGLGERGTKSNYRVRWYNVAEQAREVVKRLAERFPVRIMPRIEAPTEARKPSTPAKKLARLQSDSFYGAGGVLQGPDWAWRSGSRSPTERWKWRLEQCQEFYDRELTHRLGYAQKIRDLGGEPTPYETFPQFLRRMADEMEAASNEGYSKYAGRDQEVKR